MPDPKPNKFEACESLTKLAERLPHFPALLGESIGRFDPDAQTYNPVTGCTGDKCATCVTKTELGSKLVELAHSWQEPEPGKFLVEDVIPDYAQLGLWLEKTLGLRPDDLDAIKRSPNIRAGIRTVLDSAESNETGEIEYPDEIDIAGLQALTKLLGDNFRQFREASFLAVARAQDPEKLREAIEGLKPDERGIAILWYLDPRYGPENYQLIKNKNAAIAKRLDLTVGKVSTDRKYVPLAIKNNLVTGKPLAKDELEQLLELPVELFQSMFHSGFEMTSNSGLGQILATNNVTTLIQFSEFDLGGCLSRQQRYNYHRLLEDLDGFKEIIASLKEQLLHQTS